MDSTFDFANGSVGADGPWQNMSEGGWGVTEGMTGWEQGWEQGWRTPHSRCVYVSWRVGGFMPFFSVCMHRESCILVHHLTSHLVCKQIWLIGSVKPHLLWHCHWALREKAVRNAPLLVHALETEFSWPFRLARRFSDWVTCQPGFKPF